MKTFDRFAIAMLGLLTILSAAAQAADSGFYIGAGTGQAKVEDQPSQIGGNTFDETSTPYRIFAGYRLGVIPILDFAGEVGYRDLGKAEGSVAGVATTYQVKGADAAVLAIFPILGFDFFGKVGVVGYDLDKTFNSVTTGYSGTAPMYGVGAGFRFWRLGIRAEYERLDIDDVNTQDVGMVSVYFRF